MNADDRQLAGRAIVAKVFVEAEEQWAPIPSADGYEASTMGRVRSLDRTIMRSNGVPQTRRGQLLRPGLDMSGRPIVNVPRDGSPVRTRFVHHLVLEAFVGPRPDGMECCHEDDNKLNNYLSNLRWDSHVSNSLDRARNGICHLHNRERCPLEHLLIEPNLVQSVLPHRNCLACCRAAATVNYHRRRNGVHLDMTRLAAKHYEKIMAVAA